MRGRGAVKSGTNGTTETRGTNAALRAEAKRCAKRSAPRSNWVAHAMSAGAEATETNGTSETRGTNAAHRAEASRCATRSRSRSNWKAHAMSAGAEATETNGTPAANEANAALFLLDSLARSGGRGHGEERSGACGSWPRYNTLLASAQVHCSLTYSLTSLPQTPAHWPSVCSSRGACSSG